MIFSGFLYIYIQGKEGKEKMPKQAEDSDNMRKTIMTKKMKRY